MGYGDFYDDDEVFSIKLIVSFLIVIVIGAVFMFYSKDSEWNTDQDGNEIHECERYGTRDHIDHIPLKCKSYWKERI